MWQIRDQRVIFLRIGILCMIACIWACKKVPVGDQKIKPPVRSYIVTARIDKKGTNTNSEGTAMLKGRYDEGTKVLSYKLEYRNLIPEEISLRNGPKGSRGTLTAIIYKNTGATVPLPLSGTLTLTPLQERNLVKGFWFVSVNTLALSPEISGILTLKQN
ncbi:hypothetical protein BFS30_11205 [Pedobacter steynii]|uniref:CHRD domain-containing protein n=2 Tax=Pedobacter steynii TaxID=430522 RepID=A0A1D7QGB0_9SPHI|nr:hypothetical protein BFS30_11205 [Pedobacter steynii]